MLAKVNDLHEANPMLGLRGVRLGILKPGLYAMQVRAIIEAAAKVKAEGGNPIVEIMIPLVATREELSQVREELEPVARQILTDQGQELQVLWGTMIELPRAALVAAEIAEVAEFFSFGTNDLTQTAFGFSRDDIGKFLGLYEERKLVPANPFVTVDAARRRPADADRLRGGPPDPVGPEAGHLRRARRRPRLGPLLPRPWGWTTCPARRSGCRRPAWPPGRPPSAEPPRPPNELGRSHDKEASVESSTC